MDFLDYIEIADNAGWEFFLQGLSFLATFKKDLIVSLMSLELMFLNISLEFLEVSNDLEDPMGTVFVVFILTISACESAIALAIFLSFYKSHGTISEKTIC